MKKIFLFLFVIFALTGCGKQIAAPANNNQPNANSVANINAEIKPQLFVTMADMQKQIQNGAELSEASVLNVPLPEGILPGQIQKNFQLGDLYLALVLQPSMNILLPDDVPVNYTASWVGVLAARENDQIWTKLLEIKDQNQTDRNNPYYLWLKDKKLYLSVVDQNGAGSGEGTMKVLTLDEQNNWILDSCHYFNGNYTDGDSFIASQQLEVWDAKPFSECKNLILNSSPVKTSPDKSLGGYWQWALAESKAQDIITQDNQKDCLGLSAGITDGGDLLSSLIVDNDFRQNIASALSVYKPDYIENLEKKLAQYAQTTAQSDFYAYHVCHLADNLDLASGYLWPHNEEFIWNNDFIQDNSKHHLFVINKDQIVELKGMNYLDHTLTGGEVTACNAKLIDKQIQWSCIVSPGFAEDKNGQTIGVNYSHWLYDLNGQLIKTWQVVEKNN